MTRVVMTRVLLPLLVGASLGLSLAHVPKWVAACAWLMLTLVVVAAWLEARRALREAERVLLEFHKHFGSGGDEPL